MRVLEIQSGRWFCAVLFFGGALAAMGCGNAGGVGKAVPVSGKVLLDGKPLTGGQVTFNPDAGNTSKLVPFGQIGADGSYTLSTTSVTETVKGAPPGKYKVTVSTDVPMMGTGDVVKPAAINPKYKNPAQTDLVVEVVESKTSGYDLDLKK
jgi:hypothetical protein